MPTVVRQVLGSPAAGTEAPEGAGGGGWGLAAGAGARRALAEETVGRRRGALSPVATGAMVDWPVGTTVTRSARAEALMACPAHPDPPSIRNRAAGATREPVVWAARVVRAARVARVR